MNRKQLLTTLELVSRALANNNMVPIFQNFCFKDGQVIGYNDALGIVAPCDVEDTFAVNGSTLLGLLQNSHSEDVEFALDGQEVIIKAGRSTFKLPYLPEENFLFIEPEDDWLLNLVLDQQVLDGLTSCLMTSSRDLSQGALMGICFNTTKKSTVLYSCDGDAVSQYGLAQLDITGQPKPITVPNDFCETVLKIAEGTEATEKSKLTLNDAWAMAELDTGYKIYGRIIQNDNPLDHAALIKKTLKSKPEYVPLPKGLDHALSRARVVADKESKPTQIVVEAGRIKLLTESSYGTVRDTLAMAKHSDVIVMVSAEKVQRAMSITDEMAVMENCTVFRSGDVLLQVVSNMN